MGWRSIRWQLQLWHSVFSAFLVAAVMVLFYLAEQRSFNSAVDAQLQLKLVEMLPVFLRPHGVAATQGAPPQVDRSKSIREFEEHGGFVVHWGADGVERGARGTVPHKDHRGDEPQATERETLRFSTCQGFREVLFTHPRGDRLLLGIRPGSIHGIPRTAPWQLLTFGLILMLAGFSGGWIVSGKVLRPIREMGKTAKAISGGQLDKRAILEKAPEELRELGLALNRSYDDLAESIASQKRFTADASHELRTPVSVVLAQADTALQKERTPSEYREALEACQRAARRMKKLVADLLQLSRIDRQEYAVEASPTDMSQLIELMVENAQSLTTNHEITLSLPDEPCITKVDPDRISRAISNLLTNAIRHNPSGCHLEVSLRALPGAIEIKVADDGAGFDAAAHPRIFDRFYRVNKARSRADGGSGLGLAIVRAIIEAHGGSITVDAKAGEGATFTIALPRESDPCG